MRNHFNSKVWREDAPRKTRKYMAR